MRAMLLAAAVTISTAAARDTSVRELVATVRQSLAARASDHDLAKTLHKAELTERLDDAVIEQLETEGAGPLALDELERLRELSRALPAAGLPALFDAPRPPSSAEASRIIEAARRWAMRYSASLPDFICTETVARFTDHKGKESWSRLDELSLRVSLSGKGEEYKLVAINGRPTERPLNSLDGSISEGEFGSALYRVFLPESEAAFRWERWTRLRGRLAHVFSYRIDRQHSRYNLVFTSDREVRLVAATRGWAYVDAGAAEVLRLAIEADELPPESPIRRSSAVIDYGATEIGGQPYLLPRRAVNRISLGVSQTRNVLEFRDYQKFAADVTVKYDK